VAPSLHPLLVQDAIYPQCSSLYTSCDLLRHVKSAHPHNNVVSRLTKLFCLCKCPLLLCYTLVLSSLLLGVGFGLNLTSFWGCLTPISCVFICFIGSLEPSRMRLGKLFAYPLIELLEI
jgi:hypothetical protein